MNLVEKLTNILMPVEEEEYVEEKDVATEEEMDTRQVVNGPAVFVAPVDSVAATNHVFDQRPKLTVHTNKVEQMFINIHVPHNFDQVRDVADDLKESKACVVNYEKVEAPEQRRICDFLNGVCYVLEGDVRRISETMVLYVPNGVDISGFDPQENIY